LTSQVLNPVPPTYKAVALPTEQLRSDRDTKTVCVWEVSYVVKIWWPLPLITAGHVRRLSINNEKEQIGRLVHLVEETDWGVSHK
jgi:hypothetical protein